MMSGRNKTAAMRDPMPITPNVDASILLSLGRPNITAAVYAATKSRTRIAPTRKVRGFAGDGSCAGCAAGSGMASSTRRQRLQGKISRRWRYETKNRQARRSSPATWIVPQGRIMRGECVAMKDAPESCPCGWKQRSGNVESGLDTRLRLLSLKLIDKKDEGLLTEF